MNGEILKFLQHIEANEEDRTKLDALVAKTSCAGDVRNFAAGLGFVFELEEFIAVLDRLKEADGELSDAQLERASGGVASRSGDISNLLARATFVKLESRGIPNRSGT